VNLVKARGLVFLLGSLIIATAANRAAAAQRPNVVLILMDNFAYGELGSYGGGVTRGAPTPRLDALASEGFRSTNFNVEAQCSPSRAALLTARYAIRSGNGRVAPDRTAVYGLTQWEYTMAEMFSEAGYATAIYGKWHLGNSPGRYPTNQGFDEWWGIANSTDEANWVDNDRVPEDVTALLDLGVVVESRRGEAPVRVKAFDRAQRARMDDELTERAVSYIERQAVAGKPFFLYLPLTQTHQPRIPAPEFAGRSGNGVWGDLLMQIDAYVGRILDALERSGIADDTIVVFTSDNGGDFYEDASFPGMWRGTYFTGLEGSLRVPFIIRWPKRVPAGGVSNELLHEMDLMPTFASLLGAQLPRDRYIDGVDQGDFLFRRSTRSARDTVVVYVANVIYAIKWRNWKRVYRELDAGLGSPLEEFPTPVTYDLYSDPREERPLASYGMQKNNWIGILIQQARLAHEKTLVDEPPIKEGTPDPYAPPGQ